MSTTHSATGGAHIDPVAVLEQALSRIALNISGDKPAQVIAGDALDVYRAAQQVGAAASVPSQTGTRDVKPWQELFDIVHPGQSPDAALPEVKLYFVSLENAGLRAMLVEQEAEIAAHHRVHDKHGVRIIELEAQLASARLNENRYLWLRNHAAGQFVHPIVVSQNHEVGKGMRYVGPVINRELDRLIDAACAQLTNPTGN